MNIDYSEAKLKELDLTKRDFAELTGVAYQTIINWGSTNKIPSWVDSWLANYAKACDFDALVRLVAPYVAKS